ncbi:MAG: hypothetical protein ACRDWD_00925 [Acidimicrobiia bacterium]
MVLLGACQQADMFLRKHRSGDPFTGRHVINDSGASQTVGQAILGGTKAKYEFRIKNIDPLPCLFTIDEIDFSGGGGVWKRIYRINGNTITNKVINGNRRVILGPNETQSFVAKIVAEATAGGTRLTTIEARCDAESDTTRDVNVAETNRIIE